jgi:GNAT superfamily N-acetyltransferase
MPHPTLVRAAVSDVRQRTVDVPGDAGCCSVCRQISDEPAHVVQYPGRAARQNSRMPEIEVRTDPALPFEAVLALYAAVGWTAYTSRPDVLRAALRGASFVAGAFDGERLVGLVRAISDDASICYVQDVLVDPAEQRSGIGRALLGAVASRYGHVRQHVLLTDDEPGQRAFYESLGFREIRDFGEGTLRAFVQYR